MNFEQCCGYKGEGGAGDGQELGCGVVQQVASGTEQEAARLRPSAEQRGSARVRLDSETAGTTTVDRYLPSPETTRARGHGAAPEAAVPAVTVPDVAVDVGCSGRMRVEGGSKNCRSLVDFGDAEHAGQQHTIVPAE